MKSESKVDQSILQRISQQIAAISHHEHVQHIQKLNNFAYRLKYNPAGTNCVYKNRTYNMQLILPSTYPNDPPSLRFLDQIFHMNVGLGSGEVRMSVLEDDWSPYLTLNSLIESLDGILEEPDEAYSLDEAVLNLFQTDYEQYMSKVIEYVSLGDVVLCQSAQKQAFNNDIQDESVSDYKDSVKQPNSARLRDKNPDKDKQKKKASILMENLRQSMEEYDERSRMEMHESNEEDEGERNTNKNKEKFKIVRTRSRQHNSKSKRDQATDKNFESIKMDTAQSMEAVQVNMLQKNKIKPLKSKNSHSNSDQQPESLTLQKINSTVGVFIEELNQIEDQMSLTKNSGIKQLLREKHDSQLDMLRELLDLSEETKRRIMHKLKEQVNNI